MNRKMTQKMNKQRNQNKIRIEKIRNDLGYLTAGSLRTN